MSFEDYYLAALFEENDDNSSPINVCSSLRNSLVRLHTESLNSLSNTSTNLLLQQRLAEYSHILHDKSDTNAINSFAKPINSLLRGKIQTRHCSSWKSSLSSSDFNPIDVFKKYMETSGHCNITKDIPCDSGTITENNLRLLLEKRLDKNVQNISSIQTSNYQRMFSYKEPKQVDLLKAEHLNTLTTFNNSTPNTIPQDNIKLKNNYVDNIQMEAKHIPQKPNVFFQNYNPNIQNQLARNTTRTLPKDNQTSSFQTPQQKPDIGTSDNSQSVGVFRTARTELNIQNKKKFGNSKQNYHQVPEYNIGQKRSLGTTRSVQSKFIPPMSAGNDEYEEKPEPEDSVEDERLKHIDPKMIELIRSEIIDSSAPIGWDDIAGLEFAKTAIQEAVVWPLLRPDIFTGLRRPPKGILLFGPPGTGKTLIGKCIASQCCATFFSISASSLTSKWIGDGEKMVRALFAVARCHQPAVVFIDEIDSLLTQRSDTEHEATRRIKTEFLVQLDGAATGDEDRLLVIGATNRPQELDEAARRRLVKRLYIPLPELKAREQIINRLMSTERHSLNPDDVNRVAVLADGFSGADMRSLCSEAALGPIRAVPLSQITNIQSDQVRPVNVEDFMTALGRVRPSVSGNDLEHYTKWDQTYGSGSNK